MGSGLAIRGFNRAAGIGVYGFAASGTGTGGSPVVAGSISLTSLTSTSINLTATEATGGTGAITHQWSRAASALGPFSNIGTNALSLADTGLTPSTTYYYRLTYTDSLGSTATATYTATTSSAGGTTLAVVSIAKRLTFATSDTFGLGSGSISKGDILAVFAQLTPSSGTLQIITQPRFTLRDYRETVVIDAALASLQTNGAATSVVADYVLDTSVAEIGQNTAYTVDFKLTVLDSNGQTQTVHVKGLLKVV